MKITGFESEAAILRELGDRIRDQRIARQCSQTQLAEQCGLSEGTVRRIENGKEFRISQLIKIMSFFGIAENLDILIPAESKDYKAIFDSKPKRKRAKSKKEQAPKWKWGDEAE